MQTTEKTPNANIPNNPTSLITLETPTTPTTPVIPISPQPASTPGRTPAGPARTAPLPRFIAFSSRFPLTRKQLREPKSA